VLRVVHVMARMLPGGTERQLIGMLTAAHGVHWHATLLTLYPGTDLVADVRAAGVPVIEMPYTTATSPRRYTQVRRILRADDVDVVHCSLWGASGFGRAAVLGRRRPAVVMSERSVEDFRSPARRLVDRTLGHVTDAYIGNSDDVASFVQRAHSTPAHRVTVIRNGIDSSVFFPREPARQRVGLLRIGGVGRLIPSKAWDILIEAMPRITQRVAAELVIAGDGPQRAELETLAAGKPVTLTGFLATPTDVAEFLRTLDVFVLPSRYEGLPNAVLEALMCGVPVVATDVPGMAAAAGGAATLVPADDVDALANGVVDALVSGHAPVAPPRIQSFDAVAREHLAVFARVAAGSSRGRAMTPRV
jgi:glycosyltransferase involved in cell wall biosynthesis